MVLGESKGHFTLIHHQMKHLRTNYNLTSSLISCISVLVGLFDRVWDLKRQLRLVTYVGSCPRQMRLVRSEFKSPLGFDLVYVL